VDVALNWLWHGGVVALAAAAMLGVIPKSRTKARYGLLWVACVVVTALPAVPILKEAASASAAAGTRGAALLGPLMPIPMTWWTSDSLAIALWIGWSGVCAAQIVVATAALLAARRRCFPCHPSVEARLLHWSRVKTTGRRTRIVLSTSVRSAAVLGGRTPLIALAPAILEHLNDRDLDRVVIHEWAHVERRDDLARFVQLLMRVVAGWHPAMWWLEGQLELEREVACDEVVLAIAGSPREYAECLATLATLPTGRLRSLHALAAVSRSGLRRRLVRILAHRSFSSRPWRAIAACSSVILATFALVVGSLPIVESAAPPSDQNVAAPQLLAHVVARQTSTTADPAARSLPSQLARSEGRRPGDDRVKRASRDASTQGEFVVPAIAMPDPAVAAMPAQALPLPPEHPTVVPEEGREEVHAVPAIESDQTLPAAAAPATDASGPTPWTAAADAGVAIGRNSRDAGVAAAGFFTRFGRRLAGSF
jgi:beta-lactamase regulating signal transducer with metallopeptidase domain